MLKVGTNDISDMYLGNTKILKAYLGNNLVYEAPTLDTSGLIAYWDCEDSPVNNAWVDRINSFKLNLGGTAAKTSDGYRFNNLSTPNAAYATFAANQNTSLNTLVDKTFTCIVDCEVKYTQQEKRANIVDFGSLGGSASGISVFTVIAQDGKVAGNHKANGNVSASTVFSERQSTVESGTTLPLDTYIPITIKCGVHILENGKQEVFTKALNVKAYSIKDTPVNVNFSGCGGNLNYAFGLGVIYLTGSAVTQYAANYLADVKYKRILLYNKYK